MKISRFLKIAHYFQTFPWDTVRPKFAIPEYFVLSFCWDVEYFRNEYLLRKSEFGFGLSNEFYNILKIVRHFYHFLQTHTRVQNLSLVEHES